MKEISRCSREFIKRRRVHGRYLVVHTGKVTEAEYLSALKSQLYNGALTVRYEKNLADCVQFAISEGSKALRQGDAFDKIFIVDDVDGRESGQLCELCKLPEDNVLPIEIIFSNPCIEVWFLCYINKVNSRAGTISGAQGLAKKHGLIGGKNDKKVKGNLEKHRDAIIVAKRLRNTYGDDVMVCSPTTDMDLMIRDLLKDLRDS